MSRLAIVAPVYITNDQHMLLAQYTMGSFVCSEPVDKIAIVNKVRNEADMNWVRANFDYVEENDKNILARAWNKGIHRAFERGNDYALVINLDLVFHPQCVDILMEFAGQNPERIIWSSWTHPDLDTLAKAPLVDEVIPDAHFSCFLCDKRLFEKIGEFDEQFIPIYHEDCDMRRRVRLAGESMAYTKRSLFYHLENGAMKGAYIAQDKQECQMFNDSLDENRQRYLRKWGGPPYKEVYKIPYGGEA